VYVVYACSVLRTCVREVRISVCGYNVLLFARERAGLDGALNDYGVYTRKLSCVRISV